MMKLNSAVLLVVLSLGAAAQEIDWNKDAMDGIKNRIGTHPAPFAAGRAAVTRSNDAMTRIDGVPLDDNTLSHSSVREIRSVNFILNDTEERVGARLDYQEPFGADDWNYGSITFGLPQLRYDKASKNFLLGDVVIEHLGTFSWDQYWNKDYKLGYEVFTYDKDLGFNHATLDVYTVYLKKVR